MDWILRSGKEQKEWKIIRSDPTIRPTECVLFLALGTPGPSCLTSFSASTHQNNQPFSPDNIPLLWIRFVGAGNIWNTQNRRSPVQSQTRHMMFLLHHLGLKLTISTHQSQDLQSEKAAGFTPWLRQRERINSQSNCLYDMLKIHFVRICNILLLLQFTYQDFDALWANISKNLAGLVREVWKDCLANFTFLLEQKLKEEYNHEKQGVKIWLNPDLCAKIGSFSCIRMQEEAQWQLQSC